uniref:A2 mating type protein n=1 Tax=Heterobasidion occidentale TaxID=942053 RepID=S5REU2_9AGAM|nr:a2 mating type protein [Heterobasidion occidentale]
MSSICEIDYLYDSPRVISILSQLHHRISSSRALNLPIAKCEGRADSSYSPAASKSLQQCISLTLPQPLTLDLLALGLPIMMAQYISCTYMKAAARLKAKLEARFQHRADRTWVEVKFSGELPAPRSQIHVRTVYASRFKKTVASWAEVGMLSTQRRLLTASLKNRLRSCSLIHPAHEEVYVTTLPHTGRKTIGTTFFDVPDKTEPLTPRISIGKKMKHSAGLTTRYSTVSSCNGTLDQTTSEPTCIAPVIKPNVDAGLKSNQGAAIEGPRLQRFAGQNPSPASWDLTSFIDDFDGLSICDRSKSADLKNEDTFGTCKAAPSEHIFSLSKHSSSSINCLPIPAGIQSAANSSRLRSSQKSSCDIYGHSASSLSASKTIQSAGQRKIAPCPNRDRSMQFTYKGPVAFSRQANDMTITSSVANAKESSDPTNRCLSPLVSTHYCRRKIAPIPSRYPSTTAAAPAVTISPDIHVSSQITSLIPVDDRQYSFEMPLRLTRPLPRSPSLTSLSSNESDLTSSDDLETPPSSPPPSTIITSTASCVSSPAADKYSSSPSTFAPLDRELFASPRPGKANIAARFESHLPDIFSSFACGRDFSRFTFSR